MIYPNPQSPTLHYAVVHGYADHPDTDKRSVWVTNPNPDMLLNKQATYKISYQEFCEQYWNNLRIFKKIPTELNRFALAVSAHDDLEQMGPLPMVRLQMMQAYNSVANGLGFINTKVRLILSNLMNLIAHKKEKSFE